MDNYVLKNPGKDLYIFFKDSYSHDCLLLPNEGSQVIKFVPSNKVFLVYVYEKEFKLTHTNLYIKMVKLGRNENSLVLWWNFIFIKKFNIKSIFIEGKFIERVMKLVQTYQR